MFFKIKVYGIHDKNTVEYYFVYHVSFRILTKSAVFCSSFKRWLNTLYYKALSQFLVIILSITPLFLQFIQVADYSINDKPHRSSATRFSARQDRFFR